MLYDDTIAAVATPAGEGGIGIVRVSGPDALAILRRMFAPARPGAWRPFRMRYGQVRDADGARVDEALAVYMRAPHSFTAEDVVEISCHGGPLVVSRVLALALQYGARPAEPGEFTMRAFANGRIDLAQAEATLDTIRARTATGLALAQAQLGGWLSNELRGLRETLLGPLAYCTALVDFPEDEVEPQELVEPLENALRGLDRLLASADQGHCLPPGRTRRAGRAPERRQIQPAQRAAARRPRDRHAHPRHHPRHAGGDRQPARHPGGADRHRRHRRDRRRGRAPGGRAQPRRAGGCRSGAAGSRRRRARPPPPMPRSPRWWPGSRRLLCWNKIDLLEPTTAMTSDDEADETSDAWRTSFATRHSPPSVVTGHSSLVTSLSQR